MAIKLKGKTPDQPVEMPPQPMKTGGGVILKEKEIEERIMQVEPYIPQFVNMTRPLQIIPEHELEKYEKVRKQNFDHFQRFQGKYVNILEGLELHTNVFTSSEQEDIVEVFFLEREMGRAGRLRRRTYFEPRKWKRGEGRVTIQYDCCYNFTKNKEGNPPRIIRHDEVDPLPSFIKRTIKRLVTWHILPADCIPNSCIVNIYEAGDYIPPHIDHHDFARPFCTISFINKCNIMFGIEIQIIGDGEFQGSVEIPLPVGSVLILMGNNTDVAKHCIPGVQYLRVSITLRMMNEDKVPFRFRPDPEIENLQPFEL
ncbi:uncharacterized protein LOC110037461 [Phalaenopsis equestris]|uniref:uncharacterized protein LOC110037461 n=1 Tax=Phalaenopsis equestris TaxID=78828 RepID=UPI0009E50B77|nr:uncharacterized protein LOC110037461 [Phalaenopsis equestris]